MISCSGTIGKIAIAPDNIKLAGVINQALLKISIDENKTLNTFLLIGLLIM